MRDGVIDQPRALLRQSEIVAGTKAARVHADDLTKADARAAPQQLDPLWGCIVALVIKTPDGAARPRRADSTLVKALARAFRWNRMLESGEFTTIRDLAEREGIAPSYMTRVLRLTLLAPDIVGAILEGKLRTEVTLARVLEPFPVGWDGQRVLFVETA